MAAPNELPGAVNTSALDSRIRLWASRKQLSTQHRQPYESKWAQRWKWYRNVYIPYDDPADWWRSSEQIPTVFKIIETLVPRDMMGLFGSPDWFTVESLNDAGPEYEHLVYGLLRQTVEGMKLIPKMTDAVRYKKIMGHGWGKSVWREEYVKRQVVLPYEKPIMAQQMDEMGQMIEVETGEVETGAQIEWREEEIYNAPDFDWRTLDVIFPDPTGRGEWYIELVDTTLEDIEDDNDQYVRNGLPALYDEKALTELRQLVGMRAANAQYGGVDQIANATAGTSSILAMDAWREPSATEGTNQYDVSPMQGGTGVKLWECWGKVPMDQRGPDGIMWRLVIIADGRIVMRDDPAPTPDGKPPYFPMKDISIPGVLYGESIISYIGPLADQQSRLANMRLDEVYLNVWPQFAVKQQSLKSDNAYLVAPGGVVEFEMGPQENINNVFTWIKRPPMGPDVWNEDSYRQGQAEDVAAATDVFRGQTAGGRQTATESQLLVQQGNVRHLLQTMWNDYTIKKELLERTWRWLQMRLTTPKLVRMQGDKTAQVTLMDIQMPIDITVGGGLLELSKPMRMQMDTELLQLAQLPQAAQYVYFDELLRRWAKDRGFKDVDRLVKSREVVAQEQQQAKADALVMATLGEGAANGEMGMDQAGMGGMAPPPQQGSMPGMPGPGTASQMAGGLFDVGGA